MSASIDDFLTRDLLAYPTESERAAYRAGLSSAAAICDALATEIRVGHTKSRGRGITKMGGALAQVAEIAGNRISAFRDKISVNETPAQAANRRRMDIVRRVLG